MCQREQDEKRRPRDCAGPDECGHGRILPAPRIEDILDRDDEVRRGQWADSLLKDPRWIEAWEGYRLKLFAAMENAKTDEATLKGKEMLRIANDVRSHFEGMLRTGKVAEHEIKLEEERKKRKWPWAA